MSWVIREQKGKIYLAQSLLSTIISGQISVLKRLLKKQAKVQDKKNRNLAKDPGASNNIVLLFAVKLISDSLR